MGIFSREKKEKKLALVFDIGSSSVGGALLWMEDGGTPEMVFSTREDFPLEHNVDPNRLLGNAVKSLEIVSSKISRSGIGVPDRIFCVLSSPWHMSQIRTISYQKNTPFIFTQELADNLIKKEISLFDGEHTKKYKPGEIRSIELKLMQVLLNGYPATSPFGEKAKELTLSVSISVSPEKVLRKIEEAVERHFHNPNIKFCSFAVASFTIGRDSFAQHQDFIMIDIGGEIADVSMVKKEVLRESSSFPLGVNFILRRIASSLNATLSEAKSLFYLYKNGHAEEKTKRRLEGVINDLKKEWRTNFEQSLAGLSKDISIPSVVFVTVDRDLASFFEELI